MEKEEHIGKRILDVSNKLRRNMDHAMAEIKLTRMQSMILHYLRECQGERDVFQKDIEIKFNIRKSSVTSVLQLMEKNGYIRREADASDARYKRLVLTEEADRVDQRVGEIIERMEMDLVEVLSKDEIRTLFAILDKISEVLPD